MNSYSSSDSSTRPPRVFPALLAVMGIGFSGGGARLLWNGGSAYYLIIGITILLSAILLWRRSKKGAHVYVLMLLGTLLWSLAEVGFDPWALLPRLLFFSVIGLWLVSPWMRRSLGYTKADSRPPGRCIWQISAAVPILIIVIVAATIFDNRSAATSHLNPATGARAGTAAAEWRDAGRTSAGTRYSPLTQIGPDNIHDLKMKWTYRTEVEGGFQSTPLMEGGLLYFCTPRKSGVTALDAETGELRWRYDAPIDVMRSNNRACRGVSYHSSGSGVSAQCADRILAVSADVMLTALDAKTGRPCDGFGVAGRADLYVGMGSIKPAYYAVTSPPLIAKNVAVIGGFVSDNRDTDEPSGVIRAFDVFTGELAWAWDLGKPERHDLSAGELFTRNTPNAWGLFSYDDKLGLVYVPTGNSTPDYFGAHRSTNSELYSSAVVALDVHTGELRWSFQTTHHDLWDYDNAAQPVLVDLPSGSGEIVPALVQATKQGEVFLLDRRTGKALAEVQERPVPQDAAVGDRASPTQPYSIGLPSLAGSDLTEADMWGLTPMDQLWCRIAFRKAHYEGRFTPPSLQGSIHYPGSAGGINWGSVSVDEDKGILVVNSLHLASWVKLIPRPEVVEDYHYVQAGTPYGAISSFFMSPLRVPCQRPPYGRLSAIDLRSRRLLWTRPIGTANELGPLGMRLSVPLPMGVPHSAGSIITRSGLIFIGGTRDRYFRAFDLQTGHELWRDYLPGTSQATAMTYLSPASGKQFVAIAAGGRAPLIAGGHMPEPGESAAGAYIVAYALSHSEMH